MSLTDLDDKVLAAAIAAAGTVIGALIQLRAAWRREVADRARGAPVTKKSRRGPFLAVGILLVAAAGGGFAAAHYLQRQSERETAAMQAELKAQLAQISATAERLAQVTQRDRDVAAPVADSRAGTIVTVSATVGPCRPPASPSSDTTPSCGEADAVPVTLCASLPAAAFVTDTALYASPAESHQPMDDSRVEVGQDVGHARFLERPSERAEPDQTKLVCVPFANWDAEHAYRARLAVKHVPGRRADEYSNASLLPSSDSQ